MVSPPRLQASLRPTPATVQASYSSRQLLARRGVAFILSDFLSFGDVSRPMNLLYSAGLEVWGLQVLAESEINPRLQGDLRFVDSETQETLDITNASELLNVYQDQRIWLQDALHSMCRSRQGRFMSVSSGMSLPTILFEHLCRQGWILR